jgi:hypothetical protein
MNVYLPFLSRKIFLGVCPLEGLKKKFIECMYMNVQANYMYSRVS